jgi:hypothetical protein
MYLKDDGSITPEDEKAIRAIMYDARVVLHAADASTCEMARDIRRKANMDTADAIHIATAIRTNSVAFLTYDNREKGKRVPPLRLSKTFGTPPLEIVTPEKWSQSQLGLFAPSVGPEPAP